jgi:hypothetical protein
MMALVGGIEPGGNSTMGQAKAFKNGSTSQIRDLADDGRGGGGCQSSGTTPLRLMLDSHPNIACRPESRFLADFAHLTRESWDRVRLYGPPRSIGTRRWPSCSTGSSRTTPGARGIPLSRQDARVCLSLDYIDQLFPTWQLIHIIRDGHDVVVPHKHRWGRPAAVKAIEKWPRYIRAARAVGNSLPPGRYLQIRGEPWDPAVLEHDRKPHDISTYYGCFSAERRQTAQEQTAIYRSRVGAHRREIDPVPCCGGWATADQADRLPAHASVQARQGQARSRLPDQAAAGCRTRRIPVAGTAS